MPALLIHPRFPLCLFQHRVRHEHQRSISGRFFLYGLPVLFGVILIGSIGIPVSCTFLPIAAGSFVEQGEMNLLWLILLAIAGAVLGDHIGYGLER